MGGTYRGRSWERWPTAPCAPARAPSHRRLERAADPRPDDTKTQQRLVGGLTYYLYKPNLKLMVNYRHDLTSAQSHLLLAQGQLLF